MINHIFHSNYTSGLPFNRVVSFVTSLSLHFLQAPGKLRRQPKSWPVRRSWPKWPFGRRTSISSPTRWRSGTDLSCRLGEYFNHRRNPNKKGRLFDALTLTQIDFVLLEWAETQQYLIDLGWVTWSLKESSLVSSSSIMRKISPSFDWTRCPQMYDSTTFSPFTGSKTKAEKTLREHGGNVVSALASLTNWRAGLARPSLQRPPLRGGARVLLCSFQTLANCKFIALHLQIYCLIHLNEYRHQEPLSAS